MRLDPYPFYRHLRDEYPVAFIERTGWYAITRHEDVERVLRSPDEFSSTIMRSADRALLGTDPPEHTRVRKVVSREFDIARIRALEEWIGGAARFVVCSFVKAGGGDFVTDVAEKLSLLTIAHLLGTGEDRLTELKEWSEAVILGASRMIPPGREPEMARRVENFEHYVGYLIRLRRDEPGEDIVSTLLQRPDTHYLGAEYIHSLIKLLLIAGIETATNLMSNAMLAMFTTRDLQERLREAPSSCRAWVEETLRFDAPVQVILRQTQLDITVNGMHIPKRQVVAAFLGSANRDERHHPEPDAFLLNRPESHLAFGIGPHFCLGASVARLGATVGLSVLLEETRHFKAMEALAEIPRIPALQLRGPQRLRMVVW